MTGTIRGGIYAKDLIGAVDFYEIRRKRNQWVIRKVDENGNEINAKEIPVTAAIWNQLKPKN